MKKTWLVVLVLTFIAFILRVYRLDFVSLRGDEAFTVVFVQRTWEGLWKGISTIEPNPPLIYLALRVWIASAGASEFATRYFAVFFGVLCVPLLYRLTRAMFTRSLAAVIAAAFIALSPYQIWHSQDVRNYTMWPALSMLAMIFFWRWWGSQKSAGKGQNWNLVFYVGATLAGLYTHYYEVFILTAVNLFVFAFAFLERRWKMLAQWMGAQVVLVLLYAPWILFGTNRITTYGEASAEQSVSLIDQFSRTLSVFFISETVPADLRTLVWIPLTLVLGATLLYLAKQNRKLAVFICLYIAIPTLALYVVSIGRPLFLERYLNGIAPAYYLTFAVGIGALWRSRFKRGRVGVASVGIFFVGVSIYALAQYYYNPQYVKAPDWRSLSQFIKERWQPGDIVVQNFTDDAVSYYRNRLFHQDSPPEQQPGCDNQQGYLPVITLPKDYFATTADAQRLQRLNSDCQRIWFIPALRDQWDPEQQVEQYLARNDDRIIDHSFGTLNLQLYLTPREFESKMLPFDARLGNARLVGYRVEGVRNLHVMLYWRVEKPIDKDYTVFVHLADANNGVVAQQDRAPVFGTYPTTAWQPGESIVDAYDLQIDAPGTYTLIVGMYDPATLVRVPAFASDGARLPDDRVFLTSITVP